MWDRFKWCIIGGFAYAAGRYGFNIIKDFWKRCEYCGVV